MFAMRNKQISAEYEKRIAEAEKAVHEQYEKVKALSETSSCAEAGNDRQGMDPALSRAHADWFRAIQQLERLEWEKKLVAFKTDVDSRAYWQYARTLAVLVVVLKFGLELTWLHTLVGAGLLAYVLMMLTATHRTAHDALIYAMRAEADRTRASHRLRPLEFRELQKIADSCLPHEEQARQLEHFRAGELVFREALEKEKRDEPLSVI